jgi:hypothetical protein
MKKILFLMTCLFIFSCEKSYEKENRYVEAMDLAFDKSLSHTIKDKLINASILQNDTLEQKLSGKICAVEMNSFSDHNRVMLNHSLNQKLIESGYKVTYNIKEVDVLLLTYDKFNKIGEYVNAQSGVNGDDAYSIDNYLYSYDVKNNKLCIVTSAKGEQPENRITKHYQSMGRSWMAQDYLYYLVKHKLLAEMKVSQDLDDLKLTYPENYTSYLEENNFMNLDVKIE